MKACTQLLCLLAWSAVVAIAASAGAATIYFDGSTLPDTDPAQDPTPAYLNWDLYNVRPGNVTATYPNDSALGPAPTGDTNNDGSINGLDRGKNSFRVITGTPAFATASPGQPGIQYESLSGLGRNYGIFMTKNDRSPIANSGTQGLGGRISEFQMPLASLPQVTLTSRFKIDWSNNQNVTGGDGLFALKLKNGPGIALSIFNNKEPTQESYELRLYQVKPQGASPVLLDTIQRIAPTGAFNAQTSPGYFDLQMFANSSNNSFRVALNDEVSGKVYDHTFTGLTIDTGAGQADFGTGLQSLNQSGSELKVVFDSVRVDDFNSLSIVGDLNGDGVRNNFDIGPFELALTDLNAYRAQYPALADYAARGDMNFDKLFNNFDIGPFEALLTAPASAVPEPGGMTLLACGGLVAAIRSVQRRRPVIVAHWVAGTKHSALQ